MVAAAGGHVSGLAVLRLRGLPFNATNTDIVQFFEGYDVHDILITRTYGKANGQAYVAINATQAHKAFAELNNKFMGKRYVEVFTSTMADMDTARRMSDDRKPSKLPDQQQHTKQPHGQQLSPAQAPPPATAVASNTCATNIPLLMQSLLQLQTNQQQRPMPLQQKQWSKPQLQPQISSSGGQIIRLRGLPFSATEADIQLFLSPIDLPEGLNSIHLARHPDLRPTGEAYVHLRNEAEMLLALKKHKSMMGKRYIEVFPSCVAEMQQVLASQQQQQLNGAAKCAPFITPSMAMLLPPMGQPWPTAMQLQQPGAVAAQLGLLPMLPTNQDQMLLAVLQQQQQAAIAARVQAAHQAAMTAAAVVTPGIFMPECATAAGCTVASNSVANMLLQQQQQQQLAAASAALAANMATLDLAAASVTSATALRNPSCASSADLQYVPYYSPDSNSLSGSSSLAAPGALGALPNMPVPSPYQQALLSPTGSQSFTSPQQVASSAALDLLSSASCPDTTTVLGSAAAAASALCDDSLIGCTALKSRWQGQPDGVNGR